MKRIEINGTLHGVSGVRGHDGKPLEADFTLYIPPELLRWATAALAMAGLQANSREDYGPLRDDQAVVRVKPPRRYLRGLPGHPSASHGVGCSPSPCPRPRLPRISGGRAVSPLELAVLAWAVAMWATDPDD